MFRVIGLYFLFINGFLFLMLAQIFHKLIPLSSGFTRRSLWTFSAGIIFLAGGLIWRALKQKHPHLLKLLGISSLSAWLALGTLIYFNQDQLLFSPRKISETKRSQISAQYTNSEEVYLTVAEEITLHGWLILSQTNHQSPAIIVFPGQGGEASSYLKLANRIPEFTWFFPNYRGYGLSGGSPSDSNLFQDAVSFYDYLITDPRIDPHNIFSIGGSLGTGVATYLASQRPLRGVALFSPYNKIGGGVAQDLMPLLPTNLLIRNLFDVTKYAAQATAPVLALIGKADLVIRPARSEQLLSYWNQEAKVRIIPDGNHYSIYEDETSWQEIREFFFTLLHQSHEIIPN